VAWLRQDLRYDLSQRTDIRQVDGYHENRDSPHLSGTVLPIQILIEGYLEKLGEGKQLENDSLRRSFSYKVAFPSFCVSPFVKSSGTRHSAFDLPLSAILMLVLTSAQLRYAAQK